MKDHEVFLCVDGDGLEARPEDLARLEKVLETAYVRWAIENDGIGPYEFWGARCYDYGTDYVVITDQEDITVRVLVKDVEPEELPGLADGVMDVLGEVYTKRDLYKQGLMVRVNAVFKKLKEEAEGGNAVLVFEVEWEPEEVCA
jgi:hypothetical protein